MGLGLVLRRFFLHKKLAPVNLVLTFGVFFLVVFTLLTPSFSPKDQPIPDNIFLGNNSNQSTLRGLSLTSLEAKYLLTKNEDFLLNNQIFPQDLLLNLSSLARISLENEKADQFLEMARYISPNNEVFKPRSE